MVAIERIRALIHFVRGQKVMLDGDLAELYGVETRVLLRAVRRNSGRFPADFMFSSTNHEVARLRSQSVISKPSGRRGRRYAYHAFAEHGAIMVATVLDSSRAIELSIYVVRAFVQMREALASHKEIEQRLDELERRFGRHDRAIGRILEALRHLTAPPEAQRRRRIGFV